MKISWLENLVKEGHVRPSVRDAIYEDCGSLLKVGIDFHDVEGNLKKYEAWAEKNPFKVQAAGLAGTAAIGLAAKKLYQKYFQDRKDTKLSTEAYNASRSIVASHPDFAAHREKALARFDDLWKFAPAVALNPELATRILKDKVHSGFTNQDVQSLAIIQATYMPDVVSGMKMSKAVKTASEERLGETCAAIAGIVKEAVAANPSFSKKMKDALVRSATNTAALLAIPTLLSAGVGTAKSLIAAKDKKKLQENLAGSFSKAMAMEPTDSDMHQQKAKAQQAFELLAHFAPHVALQPVAAHAYIRKIINYGDIAGHELEHIKTMADIQKSYHGTSPFMEGFSAASRSTGFNNIIGDQLKAVSAPLGEEVSHRIRSAINDANEPSAAPANPFSAVV